MSGKRIALFLDGTWNTVNDNTNVWRLKSLCVCGSDQVCYYSDGVGTIFGQRLIGGMFGYGLDDEVLRAYKWLIENYEAGDHIFIFGFSRGAFTARSLSGLISKCGLLKPGAPISLKQLYARYRKGSLPKTIRGLKNAPLAELSIEERWLLKYSLAIPIWFIGVWDTVGALGVPFGRIPGISRSNFGFLETDLRINNTRAYHALAIDEHREAFRPTLWTKTVPKNARPEDVYPPRPLDQVEQRWFVGAHADVGGGYEDGLLAQVPLNWLMSKAALHGLTYKDTVDLDGEEGGGTIHNSFAAMAGGAYRICKLGRKYFRSIGAGAFETNGTITSTINETIDSTVFDRWRNDSTYRPKNLAAWSAARSVSIDSIKTAIRADDLSEAK